MEGVDEEENVEFKWGKKRGIGGKKKDVTFYESFHYDNVDYTLYDCVYLYEEDEPEPFIGKLIKIWENSDNTRRVKVLWFIRPCEILNYLGAEPPLDNELFLASGEGVGLANVNPLEAIAGKCNVVCISKDKRNPQPTDEQVRLADFIFYRTFDVGLCQISDKINEKIAGIEVRFLLNRERLWKSDGVSIDSNKNTVCGNTTPRADGVEIDSLTNEKSIPEENLGSSVYVASFEIDKRNDSHAKLSSEKTYFKSKMKENAYIKVLLDKQNSFPCRVASVGVQLGEISKTNDRLRNVFGEKTNTKLNVNENVEHKALSIKQKALFGEKPSSCVHLKVAERDYDIRENIDDKTTSNFKVDCNKNQGKVFKVIVNEVDDENKVKSTTNFDIVESRPSKKPKLDNPTKVFEEKNENCVKMLGHGSNAKASTNITPTFEHKSKTKRSKTKNDPSNMSKVEEKLHGCSDGKLPKEASPSQPLKEDNTTVPQDSVVSQIMKIEKVPFNKPKLDEKRDAKLPKASNKQPLDEENTFNHQLVEANRRPDAKKGFPDRRKWFKELPWEDRMQAASKQGTLVLLENLDPAYPSVEVEDIVWHGFKISCTAKMIQQTAYSSPHSGQALVAFKTKGAAEAVVTKLDEGCLLLSNERPLVGRIANPSFPGNQSTFFGHLVIDKLRGQMQREMREAVSTAHCSQPNTIEYDMAMEWCLLQETWDCTWKTLHQQQGKELKELKSNLKLR